MDTPKFKPFIRQTISHARQWEWISPDLQEAVQVVSHVLPFRTNEYVLDHLIDWNNIPDDPIYRLTFPHRDMLAPDDYARLKELVLGKANQPALVELVRRIRLRMNPHPAGQMTHNVPRVNDAPLKGLQHKYKECTKASLFRPLDSLLVNLPRGGNLRVAGPQRSQSITPKMAASDGYR
jgi:hypothetical protein